MGDHPILRTRTVASEIEEQNEIIRVIIAKCLDVLKVPLPDTFLGRKTQEAFPKEDGSSRM